MCDMQEVTHYTTSEVARLFRVDTSTVRRWAEKSELPAIKTPGGRGYRFPRAEIDRLLTAEPLVDAPNSEEVTA